MQPRSPEPPEPSRSTPVPPPVPTADSDAPEDPSSTSECPEKQPERPRLPDGHQLLPSPVPPVIDDQPGLHLLLPKKPPNVRFVAPRESEHRGVSSPSVAAAAARPDKGRPRQNWVRPFLLATAITLVVLLLVFGLFVAMESVLLEQ